jgi:hypothetical protein
MFSVHLVCFLCIWYVAPKKSGNAAIRPILSACDSVFRTTKTKLETFRVKSLRKGCFGADFNIFAIKKFSAKHESGYSNMDDGQGCQIVLGPKIPKRKNIPNGHKLYQKAVNYIKWP